MIQGAVSEEVVAAEALARRIAVWVTERGLDFAVDLMVAVVILLAGWLAIAILRRILFVSLRRLEARSPLLVKFVVSVVTKLAWAFLIVMVLAKLGVNVGPLIAGLGAVGFIVGFACQESLSNLAAGIMIAINEPFKVGDRVKVSGFEGEVQEVNMMATVLMTADRQRVVVPNKCVWGSPIAKQL